MQIFTLITGKLLFLSIYCFLPFQCCIASAALWLWNCPYVVKCKGGLLHIFALWHFTHGQFHHCSAQTLAAFKRHKEVNRKEKLVFLCSNLIKILQSTVFHSFYLSSGCIPMAHYQRSANFPKPAVPPHFKNFKLSCSAKRAVYITYRMSISYALGSAMELFIAQEDGLTLLICCRKTSSGFTFWKN